MLGQGLAPGTMANPIDLLGGLKAAVRTDAGGRSTINLNAGVNLLIQGEVLFDPDDKMLSAALAKGAVALVRNNLIHGRRADGTPLLQLDPGTKEWREVEAAQGARGGSADSRYVDPAFRAKVQANYKRDYTTAKGKYYVPRAGQPRGIVSSLLLNSFSARASKDGKGFVVFCAAIRGKPRVGETESALQSVFAGGPVVGARPMQTSEMKKNATESLREAIGSKQKLARRKASLLQELLRLAQNVGSMAG